MTPELLVMSALHLQLEVLTGNQMTRICWGPQGHADVGCGGRVETIQGQADR